MDEKKNNKNTSGLLEPYYNVPPCFKTFSRFKRLKPYEQEVSFQHSSWRVQIRSRRCPIRVVVYLCEVNKVRRMFAILDSAHAIKTMLERNS